MARLGGEARRRGIQGRAAWAALGLVATLAGVTSAAAADAPKSGGALPPKPTAPVVAPAATPAAKAQTTPPVDPKAQAAVPADPKLQPAPTDPKATQGGLAADPQKDGAKKLEEGLRAQKAGQHDKAREALDAAFRIERKPDTALALARSEMQLGKARDAAEHLAFFLREGQAAKPEDRQAAEKMFAEAKAKVGSVIVNVDIAGAEVRVDGTTIGTSPLSGAVFVEPGARTLEARKEGAPEVKKELAVAAGTESTVDLMLTPPPPPPAKPLPPPPPPPAPARNKTLILAGAGVAGGLALVGIGTAIGSAVVDAGSYDTWESNRCNSATPSCTSEFDDAQKTSTALGTVAIVTLIGAGVVGAGTAVYAFTGKKSQPSASFHVTPGGVVVKGSF